MQQCIKWHCMTYATYASLGSMHKDIRDALSHHNSWLMQQLMHLLQQCIQIQKMLKSAQCMTLSRVKQSRWKTFSHTCRTSLGDCNNIITTLFTFIITSPRKMEVSCLFILGWVEYLFSLLDRGLLIGCFEVGQCILKCFDFRCKLSFKTLFCTYEEYWMGILR